jgi:methionyl-tRNA formyltransferase
MTSKTKIVFIGGLTNGKIVYDYLAKNKFVDLALVVTYPDDCGKPRLINFPNKDNIVKTFSANSYYTQIQKIQPDFIIVAGWSELLSDDLVATSKKGTIGFHPSKLPFDRGRSVVAWQLEDGYTETGLSMFYYTDIPDGGDIIAVENISIEPNDYVNDILDKIDSAIYNLMCAYFPLVRMGKAPRLKQDINIGNFRRLRKNSDSQINWNANTSVIYNKIRAISKPYPGAETVFEGNQKYIIYKAEPLKDFPFGQTETSGTIIAKLYDKSFIVKTKDGYLKITNYEIV